MRIPIAALLLLLCASVNAELLIVVGADSPIESLNAKQIASIFLAKTNHLDNIGRVTPLILKNRDDKIQFYRKISSKTPSQINSYWTTLIFTGKGKPPREVNSRQMLIDELARNPGAITYLPSTQVNDEVKVVATLP